jgi:hypothetical protein
MITARGIPGTGASPAGAATGSPIGPVGAGTSPGQRISSGAGAFTSRVLPRARPLALPTPSAIPENCEFIYHWREKQTRKLMKAVVLNITYLWYFEITKMRLKKKTSFRKLI